MRLTVEPLQNYSPGAGLVGVGLVGMGLEGLLPNIRSQLSSNCSLGTCLGRCLSPLPIIILTLRQKYQIIPGQGVSG